MFKYLASLEGRVERTPFVIEKQELHGKFVNIKKKFIFSILSDEFNNEQISVFIYDHCDSEIYTGTLFIGYISHPPSAFIKRKFELAIYSIYYLFG